MKLIDVYDDSMTHAVLLWQLLSERAPEESISHKTMPSAAEHTTFLRKRPYKHWYVIDVDGMLVGACYLTHSNEVGIGILKAYRGHRYGKLATEMLIAKHPGKFLANINPKNDNSTSLFRSLGFEFIQVTYEKA